MYVIAPFAVDVAYAVLFGVLLITIIKMLSNASASKKQMKVCIPYSQYQADSPSLVSEIKIGSVQYEPSIYYDGSEPYIKAAIWNSDSNLDGISYMSSVIPTSVYLLNLAKSRLLEQFVKVDLIDHAIENNKSGCIVIDLA